MVAVHYRDAETGEQLGHRFEGDLPSVGETVSLNGTGEYVVLYYWELRPESCDVYARRMPHDKDAA